MKVLLGSLLCTLLLWDHAGAVTPDCRRMNFQTLDAKCCKGVAQDLFGAQELLTCSGTKDRELFRWANTVIMNKMQNIKKNNTIDTSNPAVLSKMCKMAAYLDCVFQNAGLYQSNGSINYTKTGQYLAKSQNDDYFREIIERGTVKYGWFERTYYTPKVTYLSCPGAKRNDPKREVLALPLYYVQSLNYALLELCQRNSNTGCEQKTSNAVTCFAAIAVQYFLDGIEPQIELRANNIFASSIIV